MGLGDFTDSVLRDVEGLGARVNEALFEPTIRLGVTGLSRAGKSVFITSLVSNLLQRGRMTQFAAANDGRLRTVYLQPQPDDTIARFPYESYLAALTGPTPFWPQSTRNVSELRLSFRINPSGLLGGLRGARTIHLDIVDYPGEWLLDLALIGKSYREWSDEALQRMGAQDIGVQVAYQLEQVDADQPMDDVAIQELAAEYTRFVRDAHAQGMSSGAPGRFILPGELEGSPVITFAPLPPLERSAKGAVWREMERRFNAYKSEVVRPFFRDHFARIDRQIVLVDVLAALHRGPKAVDDLQTTMADILAGFRPGRNNWLSGLLTGKKVEKILFAATKADHLHQSQHPRLTALMDAMLSQAKSRAEFAGAQTQAMAIAALRTTSETTINHEGRQLECVQGRIANSTKPVAFYAGNLPKDPSRVLASAQLGKEEWADFTVRNQDFDPAILELKQRQGLPHIRLDKALQFLIGDAL
ncbi:YcjX family protein [Falsihalocynthiibacter sp. SS001]|uniref:YcjX family protein n=1 Tax=Falsihalocynthiibacter sp. SS001 TaxID=3349698 RepID=UPI0036D336FD